MGEAAPLAIDHDAQQNDHCRMTFVGEDWWITRVIGPLLLLGNERGQTVLDVSNVDWPLYWLAAEQLMAHKFGRLGA